MRSVDAVVVGDGPAALVLAALLGRRGYRGWVLRGDAEPADEGDPAEWVTDERDAPHLERVHEALGLQDEARRTALPLVPGLRLLGPGGRGALDPGTDPAEVLAAVLGLNVRSVRAGLDALEPLAERAGQLLAAAPISPRGWLARRRLRRAAAASQLFNSSGLPELPAPLAEALVKLLPFVTHLAPSRASLAQLARPTRLLVRGPRLLGGAPLSVVLGARARRAGFEPSEAKIHQIFPERRGFRISFEEGVDTVRTEVLIDASRELTALRALSSGPSGRRLARVLQQAEPRGFLAKIRWRVDKDALPSMLGRSAVVLPSHPEDRTLWLRVAEGPSGGPRVDLEVSVAVASETSSGGVDGRAQLERLFPYFSEGRPRPGAVRRLPLFSPDLDPVTGFGGLCMATPIPRLLLAGPAVLPGSLGLDAAYRSAADAADTIARLLAGRSLTRR